MAVNTKKLIQGYINMTKYLMSKSLTILANTPKVTLNTLNNINKLVDNVTKQIKNPKDIAKGLHGGDVVGDVLSL